MKAGSQSNRPHRRRPSFQSVIIAAIAISCLGFLLHASGILIPDSDLRFVHQRHQVYRMKKFLHLSEKDHPAFNSAVGVFLGDGWNRKFCYAAHKERKTYEERLSRRTFPLKHQTVTFKTFEPHWNKLKLSPYCRFWVPGNSEILVVVPAGDMKAVEDLISSFDQPVTPMAP